MYLSIIIPAYKEEKRIGAHLESIHEYLSKQSCDYEVIVVVDGSPDNTAGVVEGLRAKMPYLRLIDNKQNCGKGCVVKQGMLEARGDWRLFTDADGATSIDQLDGFLPYTKQGYEVAIASIGLKKSQVAHSEKWYKRFFGKISNWIIQLVLLPGIHDTQRGFKLFSAKAAQDIFSKLTITRWGFDMEVLALARKFKYKIKEVSVFWKNDAASTVKLSGYLKTFVELLKIRFNLILGKYK